MTWAMIAGYVILYVVAASGLVVSIVDGKRRTAAVSAMAAFVVTLITVVIVRVDIPYHLTYVVWVFASALLALGVRAWFDIRAGRPVALLTIALAVAGTITTQASVAKSLQIGAYRFALVPLFEIKQPFQHGAAMPFAPMYGLRANGERLCGAPGVTAHGVLAVHLLHDYAIEARLICGDAPRIWLGGRGPEGNTHWAGVSRVLSDALALPIKVWVGAIGVAPVAQVIYPVTGTRIPALQKYPPATDNNAPGSRSTLEFDAVPGEVVLVTNMYFTFSPEPVVEATANGMPVPATTRDQVSSAFICQLCDRDGKVHWRLGITASAIERIDVVTIAAGPER